MEIKDTKFYKFAKKFCEENNQEFDGSRFAFFHNNDIPFDSVDRIYALYLLDTNSHLLNIDVKNIDKEKQNNDYIYSLMTDEEKEEFKLVSDWAYENYEREGMSDYIAFTNLVAVAQHGKDYVLQDSYYEGGWFGAS